MDTKRPKWSQTVTETSNAMDIADGTFKQSDPMKIARAVEHDAEISPRRKSSPYRSAMSMLTFYINRAGKNLSAKQKKVLEDAKDILREKFGPDRQKVRVTGRKASAQSGSSKKKAKRRQEVERKEGVG